MKEIESRFNFLFSFMEKLKKNLAGVAKATWLFVGVFKMASKDLSVKIAVCFFLAATKM
jgi:hypothetical protein